MPSQLIVDYWLHLLHSRYHRQRIIDPCLYMVSTTTLLMYVHWQ